ncbi:hypothetical protein [Streptomyces sp. NPDC002215]|uniref:hypothetical protein n=1 Tax=Streptomyces sp. NPDC002215 TaxID=3154412 RepID=UPI003330B626
MPSAPRCIRLAHGDKTPGSDEPLRVRFLPHPSADPNSVPGMIARLAETATPHEPANGDQEVNRQRAARNSSPNAAAHSKVPPANAPKTASSTPSPRTPRTR